MEVRNEEMVPFGELSYKEQRLLEERYEHGEVEYFSHGIKKWYLKIDPVCHSSSVYHTKPKEESNCDEVTSKEEADHSVNSVKEYPVVKMKELRNYTIGDVVRLKKTGELVKITVWNRSEDCDCCALYKVFGCYGKTKCSNFPGNVCFHKVEE